MPQQKKLKMEDKVIYQIERLDKTFLHNIKSLRCEVYIFQQNEEYFVEFRTGGFESLKCKIKSTGEIVFEMK